ncbi:MAG: hypothetical protein WBY69_16915, partial [Candidatus Acidiferrales bacterium]
MSGADVEGKKVSRTEGGFKFPADRELFISKLSVSIIAESGSVRNSAFADESGSKPELTVTLAAIAMFEDSSAKPGEGSVSAQPGATGEA